MSTKTLSFRHALLMSAGLSILAGEAAVAQEATGLEEVIVHARKRDETSLTVPVVVSAIGSMELERRAITSLDAIAQTVPQLMIGPQGGSVQGGDIAIRGISGPDSNPFGDQAVSFNIDGVQVAKATVRRMSETDLDQVEVLKGPQALFFGKNSPAGIVAIRTNDPTRQWEGKIAVSNEFEGDELRGEGYVSGPVNEKVGVRLSGFASRLLGYLKNAIPANAYLSAGYGDTPRSKDYGVRGTVKAEVSDRFDAKLKLNYSETNNDGPSSAMEYISCPYGSPQTGSIASCKPGDSVINASSGPLVGKIDPLFRDGRNYQVQKQFLGGLELNYHLTDQLLVTSVTGLYWVDLIQAQNYENDYAVALPSTNNYTDREFSQELRLASSFDGPLNFTAGGYFSDTHASTGSHTFLFAAEQSGNALLLAPGLPLAAFPFRTPIQVNNYYLVQDGTAYSFFLQGSYKPIETIEFTAGGRYSYEEKNLPLVQDGGSVIVPALIGLPGPYANKLDSTTIIHPTVTKGSWTDFSPEFTLSYRPTPALTLFASYKHGFLSGGFNSSSVDFAHFPNLSYNPETVEGYEAGVKGLFLDNKLRVNLAGYTYDITDLQVTNFTNATASIRNAGAANVKGVEADFAYRTPLAGLGVHGAGAYNSGHYDKYFAPCYNGQTQSMGCTTRRNPVDGSLQPLQDLAGTPLVRAPEWNLSGGFDYETPLTDALDLGLASDVTYSSSYLTDATSSPYGRQPDYVLVDSSIRVSGNNDHWEVALIGRNLTNTHYFVATADVPFTGSAAGGTTGKLGDRFGSVNRGREIMLRYSMKFGG